MAYEPSPLISSETPRSRRHRRRRQQQSSCGCCLIVLASLVLVIVAWRGRIFSVFRGWRAPRFAAQATYPLELGSAKAVYPRYDLVPLQATVSDPRGKRVAAAKPPEVVVTRNGEVVTTVGHVDRLTLRFDRNSQTYRAFWPVPWNAIPGEYIAEARLAVTDPAAWVWETEEQRRTRQREERRRRRKTTDLEVSGPTYCVARARFAIEAQPPRADIGKGTCAATWENDFRASRIPKPTGGEGDWPAMLDWCEYMGADTFWFRGAVTEVYHGTLTDEQPFNSVNLKAIPQMAAETRRRGLKFGAWAAAYATYPTRPGSNARKPRYRFARDISRGTGAIRDLDFVSLLEPKRVDHLATFVAQMQADPNVDYVGLDYMRSDRGGYEMVDRFTREMPVKLPADFFQWSEKRRMLHVANKREREWDTDPDFFESWNWWRAHTGAGIVRDVIGKAQLTKPLWIFVLSWKHGQHHGQDPIMFTDAGVGLLCPMLYQVDNRAMFDTMVKDWGEYLGPGQVNVAPGDQVDFRWHQRMRRPRAAPEELYDRLMTAHRGYIGSDKTVGAFWHDISRAAIWGDRGPYPGTEWALAGGAAFTGIRNNWQVYPFTAALEAPSGAAVGAGFEVKVTLTNLVKKPVKRVTLRLATTEGVVPVTTMPLSIGSLDPGQTLTQTIEVKLTGPAPARANRHMVAFFLTWPDDDYGDTVRRDLPRKMIVMKYVQGR